MKFLDGLISDRFINSIYNKLDRFESIKKYTYEEMKNRVIKECIKIQELEIYILKQNIKIEELEKNILINNKKIQELEDLNLNNNKYKECAICLEGIMNISKQKTLECEHTFHKKCIDLVYNHKCPLCNQISNRI